MLSMTGRVSWIKKLDRHSNSIPNRSKKNMKTKKIMIIIQLT